jgi:hypothetical protein
MLCVCYYYAECRYAECHYAECNYAECQYAGCHSLQLLTNISKYSRKTFYNILLSFQLLDNKNSTLETLQLITHRCKFHQVKFLS